MPKKYRALRIISSLYIILSGFVGVASIVLAVFMLPNIGAAAGVFIGGLLSALGLAAFSELLIVLVDIEENTRTLRSKPTIKEINRP